VSGLCLRYAIPNSSGRDRQAMFMGFERNAEFSAMSSLVAIRHGPKQEQYKFQGTAKTEDRRGKWRKPFSALGHFIWSQVGAVAGHEVNTVMRKDETMVRE